MEIIRIFVFLLTLATVSAPAFAVQKVFTCSSQAFSGELDVPTIDSHGLAGIITSDMDPGEIDLYEAPGAPVHGPKGTVLYIAVGWGDGKSDVVYLAIPASIAAAKSGEKVSISKIETSYARASLSNPLGVSRTSFHCLIGN